MKTVLVLLVTVLVAQAAVQVSYDLPPLDDLVLEERLDLDETFSTVQCLAVSSISYHCH